jgi:hypothetical protein
MEKTRSVGKKSKSVSFPPSTMIPSEILRSFRVGFLASVPLVKSLTVMTPFDFVTRSKPIAGLSVGNCENFSHGDERADAISPQ